MATLEYSATPNFLLRINGAFPSARYLQASL